MRSKRASFVRTHRVDASGYHNDNNRREVSRDYSNLKAKAGKSRNYTRARVAAAAAATIIARCNLIHGPCADRDVKIKDAG